MVSHRWRVYHPGQQKNFGVVRLISEEIFRENKDAVHPASLPLEGDFFLFQFANTQFGHPFDIHQNS
jgi:hypothetical protein